MTEPEKESMQQLPLFPDEAVDGFSGDESDLREEARRRIRVLNSVRDYMGSRNRRGKRRHAR